ncbi:MAG: OB-fold nucleic acid binding domain-containing protein [Candidatus ainarchaeum sp.]|nr:OB-fold nucleic acid binding domain-containing protein [Candidatus ainarchaeum sp.]MDD3975702.1 OB-fold nucleic acid binding domain-containing protein [Candidatus ainarchaeum sp.]
MQLNNAEDIFKKIKVETKKTDEELLEEINKIKDKYQGLLSDVGANIMLAKQYNVDLDIKSTSSIYKISEISSSQDGVSLYARVKSIPPFKTYNAKDGSLGKIQNVFLQDDTGEIKLNLFNEKVDLIDSLNLEKNSLVLIKDAYVTTYNDNKELALRYGGSIILPENAPDIKPIENIFIKVSEIDLTDKLIETIGRIIAIYPIREFEDKNQKKRFVLNFEISDGIKSIKCTAWDQLAHTFEKDYKRGDIVKLTDVNVREGLYDFEININWNSTIFKNPKNNLNIPSLEQLIDAFSQSYENSTISSLEDSKNYEIEATIVSVNRNKLRYFKCPDCKEKIQLINESFICEKCNKEVDNPEVNLFASIDVDDGTGILKVVFFKEVVEKIFNIKKEDFIKEFSEEEKENIFSKLEDDLLGKRIKIKGRAKLNGFSSEIELLANSIDFV